MLNNIVKILSVFFIMSCSEKSSANNQYYQIDKLNTEIIDIGYRKLKLTKPLVRKQNTEDEEVCMNWAIEPNSLSGVIKKMRKVDASEWYQLCYQFPCWYEGEVSNGKSTYSIEINAASYITLSNDKETLHFIMEESSEFFVTPCDCCEYPENDQE